MSAFRPECGPGAVGHPGAGREETLKALYKSLAKRRSLIRGQLEKDGKYCAMGCLEADGFWGWRNPIKTVVVDEVAAVNDKLGPRASPRNRWKYVMKWLRGELKKLEVKS